MLEALQYLDGNILLWIQENIRNDALTPIVITITSSGNAGFIWVLLSLFLLLSRNTRKIGLISLLALIIMLIFNNLLLKNLFARTRPYDVIGGLVPLVQKPMDFSFPSGHTAAAFSAGSVMFHMLPRKFGVPILILAILMGFSRLYVGVHYPSDVIFAVFEGIFIGYVAEKIVNK